MVRTQLRQAVVEAMERRLAERMPGQLNNALHPAPQVRISAAVELAPENIGADTVLRQSTGMNTCFMHSVLNSMMLTAQGRSLLARHVTPDGRLYVEGRENWDGSSALHAEFSRLENSMAALYAKHDGKWSAGGMGLAAEFAGIFGMTPVLYSVEDGEEKLQGKIAGEKDLEAISRHLNNDRMVLLFKDNHYMAVAGTEAGGLILRNSLTGEEEHWPLDRLAGATVDVRAYPEA